MPKKRIIKSDDDTVLWQRVITEVKPLKSTIELAEFAAIFARSDHVAASVAKPSGRPRDRQLNLHDRQFPHHHRHLPEKPILLICVRVNAPALMDVPSGGFFGVMCQLTGGLICMA
jgi:hypothetical protein